MNLSINKEKFNALVKENRMSIPIFFYADFLDIVTQNNWKGLVIEDNEKTIAIFIIHERTKFGQSIIVNPILTPFCGLWMEEANIPKVGKIVPIISDYLKKNYTYINFTLNPIFQNHLHWEWEGFHQSQKMTLVINNQEYARAFQKYNSSLKNDIKFAAKTLMIERIENIGDDLSLLTPGLVKSGIKIDKAQFVLKNLSRLTEISMYKAYDIDNHTHAVIMVAEDEKFVYNLLNGRAENCARGAMSILIDHVIKKTMGAGKSFDFEGSSMPGVYKYFKSFNPEFTTYHHLYKTKYTITDTFVKTFRLI